MDVTVQERKFALRSEYDISASGNTYFAQKAFFSFLAKISLMSEDDRLLATMKSRFSLRAKYDFEFSDGRIYLYRCEKFWKSVFVCQGNGLTLRLYEHKGLRWSIFQDDRQIAAFTKNRVTVGKGNQYDIRMDADADVILIICMVLTVNTSENDDNDTTITVDFGNIGPEDRPFDESWDPS